MGQNLHKLFKNAIHTPESRLSENIVNAILYKNAKITKVKTFGYLCLSILSLFGSIFSIKNLIEQSIKLGFFNYFSLAFSDSGIVAKYWKEYTLSLVDSLPIMSLIFSLFLIFILFISIRRAFYQFKSKLLVA